MPSPSSPQPLPPPDDNSSEGGFLRRVGLTGHSKFLPLTVTVMFLSCCCLIFCCFALRRHRVQRQVMAVAAKTLESQMSLRDEAAKGAEQLSAEQLSHARRQLNGERARRGEASAAAKVQVEASAAQLAEVEAEASAAAQAKDT